MKKTRKVKQTKNSTGLIGTIRNFSLSRTLQDDVERLTREKELHLYELGKTSRKNTLLEKKNKGMIEIEHKFLNSETRFHQDKLTQCLKVARTAIIANIGLP